MVKIITKPWGHERIWAHTEKYVGKILYIKEGHKLSLQHHDFKDETIYVMEGKLELFYGHNKETLQRIELEEDSSWRIEPKMLHRFSALNGPVTLLEVSTPELEDVIRHEDLYGRTTK